MRLSMVDAMCYALMVGLGEAYFVANAVRLGAAALELGLLVALPLAIGAAGPIAAMAVLARVRRRKPIVVSCAAAQAATLGVLAALEAAGALTPRLMIAVCCAYQLFNQAAAAVWSSWYGDLVPARIRGRYFSRRSRGAHLATCVAIVGAGVALQVLEPGSVADTAPGAGGRAYTLIFALAAVCRFASSALLASSPEPEFGGLAGARESVSALFGERGGAARRLLAIAFAMQLAVYLGSPYFSPFMLADLELSYLEYMAGSVAVVLAKSTMLIAWGRAVDRFGARACFQLALMLVAFIPLPWVFAGGIGSVIAAQMLSGFAWSGHELSQFSLLLESAGTRLRPQLFAAVNAATGASQLLGSIAGGAVLTYASGDYRMLFVATMVARFAVAATAPLVVPAVVGGRRVRRHQVLLRVIGFRPGGGVTHRPITIDED